MSASTRETPDVLLVDDNDDLRYVLATVLSRHGYHVVEAADEPAAVDALRLHRPSLVLSDLRLPTGDGLGVLRAAKELDPALPVILMTGYGAIEEAVTAVREGALDYLPKPVDHEHLVLMVSRAIEQRRLVTENLLLKEALGSRHGAPTIIGEHPLLLEVLKSLRRVAPTETTVLLGGESGTGKELFARALHAHSDRADGPFVAINCAAIPETLLESELFGHEKGAFTGANARKPGKFEVAHGGTLFLDEIGEMPVNLQAKVLRVLEERSFERVGSNTTLHVDVRLVAATNRDLRAAVAARTFREDLFFRLSVFPITIPPLRDRPTDVPILARHFVERFAREQNKRPPHLSTTAIEALERHAWPGNVRELQNCIERAVILAEGDTIHAQQLNLGAGEIVREAHPAPPRDPWDEIDLSGTLPEASRRVLMEVERRKIAQALEDARWDHAKASAALQIPPRLLLARIRDFKLAPR
ncbi:acetoacetate metabolism regulatory protein AtoC [Luteitalea sp. TBR-22]|uniref:sigma-54-dependent transcriptional regulator n=1 Tax=Luteitalea sp. TBR-22 TaxID=2802971 RepID=UPI001AF7EE9D|nr:sigma-54 dependent transcriptional regulator [Luteitalea sp. TBR-22]BCS34552.1 acetoacetate metabolism regulatory protein AtoC [Luteitalea sp. TBR-22]